MKIRLRLFATLQEYLPPGSNLTSFPAKAEIPVRLWIDARGLGASGYRLYIFYP